MFSPVMTGSGCGFAGALGAGLLGALGAGADGFGGLGAGVEGLAGVLLGGVAFGAPVEGVLRAAVLRFAGAFLEGPGLDRRAGIAPPASMPAIADGAAGVMTSAPGRAGVVGELVALARPKAAAKAATTTARPMASERVSMPGLSPPRQRPAVAFFTPSVISPRRHRR